ncbi:STAS domain-containing protein [Mycolicibacterium sp. Dal123E01]|uniref:STAS domain-containing protein n=1 Tax=Mycolicibacterium sp. Dal123E01 TaxID=3457578 RepID=UPI00403E68B5
MTNDQVRIRSDALDGAVLLTIDGTLDSVSYRPLRDSIMKAALDEPRAVIVDLTTLHVPTESALAVFTSARWHIARWPEVPLLLVSGTERGRNMLSRNGITRYVPIYHDVHTAADAAARQEIPGRRRARVELSADAGNVRLARGFVAEWMENWSHPELTSAAKVVVTALVENAIRHAGGATALRMEIKDDEVTVAVEDGSAVPASIREKADGSDELSSLKIVDAICRAWGSNPTPGGKVIWCVIGPENRL